MHILSRGAAVSAAAGAGIIAALASVSIALADVAPQDAGPQQQIINNYQCFGGGAHSVTLCIFNSVNYLACNDSANAAKNLSLLSSFFRLYPDAKVQNLNQQQWQQIVNNYQCYGGGNNSVTICSFNSTNYLTYNAAAQAYGGANNQLLSYFFGLHPDAKKLQKTEQSAAIQAGVKLGWGFRGF